MSKPPSPDDMRLAAQWLDAYDKDADEFAACQRVSAWLDHQADALELRQTCRDLGISVALARKMMRGRRSPDGASSGD